MGLRIRTPTMGSSPTEFTLFVIGTCVVVYATLAQTLLTAVLASLVFACLAVALSLSSMTWAWRFYFLAICANGVQTSVTGLTVRPEYFAAPIFVLALYTHSQRNPSSTARRPIPSGVYLGLAGFVTVAIASSIFLAPDAGASVRMAVQLIVAMLAVIPLGLVAIDIRGAIASGTVILSVISAASIVYFFVDPSRRVSGLAFEYNVMGSLCAGWIGVLYYFADDLTVVTRRIMVMCVPIVGALILTSTRAAWVALVFILMFWLARNVTKNPVAVVGAVLGATVLAFYLQAVYYSVGDEDTFLWRVVHVVDVQNGTGAYRVQLWNDAITQISTREWASLFGTGLNSFTQFNPIDPTNVSAAYLSSMWLAIVYDVGFVGSAFFVVLVVSLFLTTEKKWRAVPLFAALALCTSVTNIIWFAFPWTFLALVVNASLTAPEPARPKKRNSASGAHRRRHKAVAS